MSVGRNREFDTIEALEKAMNVFWKNGYAGSSLSELTKAMGINKPSLYAAYGNKESLFIKALQHYVSSLGSIHIQALTEDSKPLQQKLRQFLNSIADMHCNVQLPGGCMVASSSNEYSSNCMPDSARQVINEINMSTLASIENVLIKAKELGQLDKKQSPKKLATYLTTLTSGMAVMARNGTSREDLQGVIDQAIAGL